MEIQDPLKNLWILGYLPWQIESKPVSNNNKVKSLLVSDKNYYPMKRRNFVGASGSTVFSSLVHSGFQRPVIGLDFEISDSAINSDPSTVNSFLINFDRLKITPQYLDDDQDITITVILKIEGKDISKRKRRGLAFTMERQ